MTTTITRKTQHRKIAERKKAPIGKTIITCIITAFLLVGLYVLSVIWRVSIYQQKIFGRSALIPLSLDPRRFTDAPTMDTYGAFTFKIDFKGKPIVIHKQVINGFQHTFGSALASYELGEEAADVLFRLNEYMEAYCWKDGFGMPHHLDTKKDLHNNAIGRAIGAEARERHLYGQAMEEFLADRTLDAIREERVIPHWLRPEVKQLPTLEEYGCPWLPKPKGN